MKFIQRALAALAAVLFVSAAALPIPNARSR